MQDQSGGLLAYLFGSKKESPEDAEKRKKKEEADKRAAENIQKAIAGVKKLKQVADEAKKKKKQ